MADLAVLSLIAVPWLVSCVVVFLRRRWFSRVLQIGAGLIALLAVAEGVLTESSDREVPWIVVSAFVGGLMFVGLALGAIFGRELSRARARSDS